MTAKRLRRQAEKLTEGAPARGLVKHAKRWMAVLVPGSTRDVYQRLKRG